MTYKEQISHPKWQKKRLEILQRDNFTCIVCGSNDKELNVHHLYYKSDTMIWDYDDECYVSLCKNCHDNYHSQDKVFGLLRLEIMTKNIDLLELDKYIEML